MSIKDVQTSRHDLSKKIILYSNLLDQYQNFNFLKQIIKFTCKSA